MNFWQRSVKRKYDTLIVDELQRNQKNDEVSVEVCFKGCDKVFGKEGLPDSSSMNPLPKLDSISSDGLVLGMSNYSFLAPETEQLLKSVTEVEDFADTTFQHLHKKKGLQHSHGIMGTEESSSFISLGKREKLAHLLKNHHHQCSSCENELIILRQALRTQHEALNALYVELEEERNASAVAASEAINMIARLQVEKAAMQMENHHYKMIVEEKGAHDAEAIALLKDILMRKEDEILVLEDELEAYRQILRRFELEGWGKDACQRILFEMGGKEAGLRLIEHKEESINVCECFDNQTSYYWDTSEDLSSKESCSRESTDQNFQACSGCPISNSMRKSNLDILGELPSCKSRFGWVSQNQMPSSSDLSKGLHGNSLECAKDDRKNLREKKPGEPELGEEECTILYAQHCAELDTGGTRIVSTQGSHDGKRVSIEPIFRTPPEVQEDQYVWEHMRRLEERLEHLGEQQQCQRDWFAKVLHNEQAPDIGKGSVCSYTCDVEGNWRTSHSLQRVLTPILDKCAEAENVEKNGCRFQNRGCQDAWRASVDDAFTQDIGSEKSFHRQLADVESEELHIEREEDAEERVHDVYVVQDTFRRSRSSLSERSMKSDAAAKDHEVSPGIIDSLEERVLCENGEDYSLDECGSKSIFSRSKQFPVDYKAGIVTDLILQSIANRCHSRGASFIGKDDHTSVPGEEVQQLTLRLQAIEAERVFMKQAIESLRKENRELKLLQEIAQQLRELKGTVEKSEQPKQPLQPEQLSFVSFLKKIMAFAGFQCTMHPQHKFAYSSQESADCSRRFGDHAGLSHLLEKSPDTRIISCVTRGLKVKLPFEEGVHSFQNISGVSVCDTTQFTKN